MKILKYLLAIILFVFSNYAYSLHIPVSDGISGTSITSTAPVLTVTAPTAAGPTQGYDIIKNQISLSVNFDDMTFIGVAYDISVDVQVTETDIYGVVQTPYTITLNLQYNPFARDRFNDKSVYEFSDAQSVDISIISITDNINALPLTTAPANVDLVVDMDIERYFEHSSNVLGLNLSYSATEDEIDISWTGAIGAEGYDLEWAYVDDYKVYTQGSEIIEGTYTINELTYDFKNNSTRVTLNGDVGSYSISNIFSRGYVMFRIRPVYRDKTTKYFLPGKWSGTESGSVNNGTEFFQITNIHANNLNWQYTATYAEEGKKKELVNYFDGAYKARQSVTKNNSENEAIVGETIYDYQGRPAIQVMPVPSNSPILGYYENFNRNMLNTAYSKEQFDLDGTCSASAEAMKTTSGASNYYSGANPDRTFQQEFLPDAGGYPFAQVEYTPDLTGRIRRQSGVGPTFKLDGGHEVQYFYGQPSQEQLDRLFGSEVGNKAHYTKNLVIDPNGQMSVTYMDMQGRVIATALAGEPSDNLQAIPSEENAATAVTTDLFGENYYGISITNKVNFDKISFNTEQIVSSPGNHTFNYSIDVPQFQDICEAGTICFECRYNLVIQVIDDCGNILYEDIEEVGQLVGDPPVLGEDCNETLYHFEANNSPFVLNLPVGKYTISKTLVLNQDKLEEYFESYMSFMEAGNCYDTEEEFIQNELDNIDASGCEISCDDCLELLGTKDQFIINGGTGEEWERKYKECTLPCTGASVCESLYLMLLADVSPGGQYAQYLNPETFGMKLDYPLSIFNKDNRLPDANASWKNPTQPSGTPEAGYYDKDDVRTKIPVHEIRIGEYLPDVDFADIEIDEEIGMFVYPENLKDAEDFIFYWESGWERSLVEYHPEYAFYEWCEPNTVSNPNVQYKLSSEEYDKVLLDLDNYYDAAYNVSEGYKWTMMSGAHTFLDKDPYFATGGPGASRYSDISAIINTYKSGGPAGSISMKNFAQLMVTCPGLQTDNYNQGVACNFVTSPPSGGGTNEEWDAYWNNLKMLYLGEKWRIQEEEAMKYALANGASNECIGSVSYNIHNSSLLNDKSTTWYNSKFFTETHPCAMETYNLYRTKERRFSTTKELEDTDPEFMNQLTNGCDVPFDLGQLMNHLAIDGNLLSTGENLRYYGEFTKELYEAIYARDAVGTFRDYKWTAIYSAGSTPDQLEINFVDDVTSNTDDNKIYMWFDDPLLSWNDVIGVSTLTYSHSIEMTTQPNPLPAGGKLYEYHFEMYVTVDDGAGGTIEALVLGYTYDLDLTCEMHSCKQTYISTDLSNLMNALVRESKLGAASESLDLHTSGYPAPYFGFLTSHIQNYFGATSGFTWEYDNGTSPFFKIKNGTDEIKLAIDVASFTGGIVQNDILNNYISDINVFSKTDDPTDPANRFLLSGYYKPSGTGTETPFSFEVDATIISPVLTGDLDILDCSFPELECSTPLHQISGELENLFNNLIEVAVDINNPPPITFAATNINTDLELNILFTPLMKSYLGEDDYFLSNPSLSADNDYLTMDIAYNDGVDDIVVCQISFGPSAADLTTLIGFEDLIVNEVDMISGKPYKFSVRALFSDASNEVIDGYTTCFPMSTCPTCEDFLPPNPANQLSVVSCTTEYNSYSSAVDALNGLIDNYNSNNSTSIQNVEKMLSTDFYNYNLCVCSDDYVAYIQTFINSLSNNTPPSVTIMYIIDYLVENPCDATIEEDDTDPNVQYDPLSGRQISPEQEFIKYLEPCYELYMEYVKITLDKKDEVVTFMLAHPETGDPLSNDPNKFNPSEVSDAETLLTPITWAEFVNSGYCNCVNAYKEYLESINAELIQDYDQSGNPTITSQIKTFDVFVSENGCGNTGDVGGDPCPTTKRYRPSISPTVAFDTERCLKELQNTAILNGKRKYQQHYQDRLTEFASAYRNVCLNVNEDFTMQYTDKEYHFTLYYYDQAGNLVRTVPPEGVNIVQSSTDLNQINEDRTKNQKIFFTEHTLVSTYEYNSLNQLIRQSVPDHELMNKWKTDTDITGLPANLDITDIKFIDAAVGYAVGNISGEGYIYTTADGGETWTRVKDIETADLEAISMSGTTGYAVGVNGLLFKSNNSGASWQVLPGTIAITETLNDIYASSSTNAIAVGNNATVKITTDGGSTWSNPTNPIPSGDITAIKLVTGSTYIATVNDGGYGKIYRTTDAGVNWSEISPRTVDLNYVVRGYTSTHFYAFGKDGIILKSTDLGVTWEYLTTTQVGLNVKKAYFRDDANILVLTTDGEFWKSNDGCLTWSQLTLNTTGFYNDFSIYSNGLGDISGYAVGNDGIVIKIDFSGNTNIFYEEMEMHVNTELPTTDLYSVLKIGNERIWIGASDGVDQIVYVCIQKQDVTTEFDFDAYLTINENSGASLPTDEYLEEIFFGGSGYKDGYIRTSKGRLIRTDHTSTPDDEYVFTTNNIVDFDAYYWKAQAVANTGYGDAYSINTYTTITTLGDENYPNSTYPLASYVSGGLNSIASYTDYTKKIIVGDKGDILRFSSGTVGWEDKHASISWPEFNDIAVHSGTDVVIVGDNGIILKSTDGGVTFLQEDIITDNNLNAASFSSATKGLIVGDKGIILESTTGGADYTVSASANLVNLTAAADNGVHATGEDGTIIYYDNVLSEWVDLDVPNTVSSYNINGIYSTSATNAFAVTDNGRIIKTTDGTTWTLVDDITTAPLNSISELSDGGGFIAGDNSTILFYKKGLWAVVPIAVYTDYNDVLTNDNSEIRGNFVGDNGVFITVTYHSSSNAYSINSYSTGVTDDLYSLGASKVSTLGPNGYSIAMGENSTIIYTSDISSGWNTVTVTGLGTVNLNSIYFENHIGYAVGDNGTILKSDDGGVTWTKLDDAGTDWVTAQYTTGANLYDVYFHDYLTGYAVGDDGVLLKTIDGGVSWEKRKNTNTAQDARAIWFTTRTSGIMGGLATYAELIDDQADIYSGAFYYDRLGRLVVSQNTKQFNEGATADEAFSYTLYDALGRPYQGGKITNSTAFDDILVRGKLDDGDYTTWITGGTRTEVINTFYDEVFSPSVISSINGYANSANQFSQDNLRLRVATVTYQPTYSATVTNYESAIHYSYDIHGMVKHIVNDLPQLGTVAAEQQFKHVLYDYDLVNGNVNQLSYQLNEKDQWLHKYTYDEDNKLEEVKTSADGVIWDRDAKYLYYTHGALARTEIGEHKVQGIDFAYTLQGWLKGVNSNTLNAARDLGRDGDNVTTPMGASINSSFGRDVFGFTLSYYDGDYDNVGNPLTGSSQQFEASTLSSEFATDFVNLYNGNISHMVTAIMDVSNHTPLPQGTAYEYDQLNRIVQMKAHRNIDLANNVWLNNAAYDGAYESHYTYDANGNILTLTRNGGPANTDMDNFSYQYDWIDPMDHSKGKHSNKLYHVNDDVTFTGNYAVDVDDQGAFTSGHSTINTANNYEYDEIGNLVRDDAEEIEEIIWRVDGKIKEIKYVNNNRPDLEFIYTPTGIRVAKIVKPDNTDATTFTYTYYGLDATGTTHVIYEQEEAVPEGGGAAETYLRVSERIIYGMDRVGNLTKENILVGTTSGGLPANYAERNLGEKRYEGKNHLSNVLTLFSDIKIPIDNDLDGTTDWYEGDPRISQDYYPFGMLMPERQFVLNTEEYRYGFNGQERDDEVSGAGNSNTAKFWQYSSRLGRRFNLDPIFTADVSRYSVNGNNPIYYLDPNGDFKTKTGAFLYNASTGFKGKIMEDKTGDNAGEYYIDFGNKPTGKMSFAGRLKRIFNKNGDLEEVTMRGSYLEGRAYKYNAGNLLGLIDGGAAKIQNGLRGIKNAYNAHKNTPHPYKYSWSDIWNSPHARYYIPDFYEYSFSYAGYFGGGIQREFTLNIVLRGSDPGIYTSKTTLGTIQPDAGGEIGISGGYGYFLNTDPREASTELLSGYTGSINGGLELNALLHLGANIGADVGFSENGRPTAVTTKASISLGAAASIIPAGPDGNIGFGATTKLKPLIQW